MPCLLNGFAIAISGTCSFFSRSQGIGEMISSHAQPGGLEATDFYPPLRSWLRRNYPAAISEFDAITSGKGKDISPRTDAIERL